MRNKVKRKLIVLITVFIMSLSATNSVLNLATLKVNAASGGWVDTHGTISGETDGLGATAGLPAGVEPDADGKFGFSKMEESLQKKNVNWLDRTVGLVFGLPAMILHYNLAKANIDIDGVILGRVKTGATSMFSFELETGNPYGYAGAMGYSALRAVIIIFFGITLIAEIAKQGISLSAEGKSELKQHVYNFMIAVCALYIAPQFVDLLIYLRDGILINLAENLRVGTTINIVEEMWLAYADAPGIMNAIMYFGAVLINIWFMGIYAGIALATTALFAFFPILLLIGYKDKNTLTTWIKAIVTQITVPCIDFFLLFIPIFIWREVENANKSGNWGLAFVYRGLELVILASIVPMRNVISSTIGLGGGAGADVGINGLKMVGKAAAGAAGVGLALGGVGLTAGGIAIDNLRQKKLDEQDSRKAQDEHGRMAEMAVQNGAEPKKGDLSVDIPKGTGGGGAPTGGGAGGGGGTPSGEGAGGGAPNGGAYGGASASTSANRNGATYNVQRAQNLQQLDNARQSQMRAQRSETSAKKSVAEASKKVEGLNASRAKYIEGAVQKGFSESEAAKQWDNKKRADGRTNAEHLESANSTLANANEKLNNAERATEIADNKVNEAAQKEQIFAEADKSMGGSGKEYGSREEYANAVSEQNQQAQSSVNATQSMQDRLATLQSYTEPDRYRNMSAQGIYDNATAAQAFSSYTKPVTLTSATTGKRSTYRSQAAYAQKRRQAAAAQRMAKSLAAVGKASMAFSASAASLGTGDATVQRDMARGANNLSQAMTDHDMSVSNIADRAYDRNDEMVRRGGDYIPPDVYMPQSHDKVRKGETLSTSEAVMDAIQYNKVDSKQDPLTRAFEYDRAHSAKAPNKSPIQEKQEKL